MITTSPPEGARQPVDTNLLPELETDRLRLRQFTPADLDELARICANPEVMKYLGLRGEPMSRAETETALESMYAHWQRRGFGRWAVTLRDGGRLIGYGGLRSFGDDAELVYLLDKPFWGRGLATEVAHACLGYGFGVKKFGKVLALARPDNLASRRVLEKVGLTYKGPCDFFRLLAESGVNFPRDAGLDEIEVVRYETTLDEYGARAHAGGTSLLSTHPSPPTALSR